MIYILQNSLKNLKRLTSIFIIAICFGLYLFIREGLIFNKAIALEFSDKPKQRNVLLLISDNQGTDAGCYGNPVIITPNLDSLAKNGVLFTNAFATVASCSACRSVIYTGLFNHTNGQYGHAHQPYDQHTHRWVKSIPSILNEMGYRTGIIGKLHVKPHEVYPFKKMYTEGFQDNRNGFAMAEKAKEFLSSEPDKPFLLVIGLHDPHRSKPGNFGNEREYPGIKEIIYHSDNVIVPPYLPDEPEVRKELAEYYQAVSRLDQGVGYILKALKEVGREKETLVIFISDGGPAFPGSAYDLYDPAIHQPMIIYTPTFEKKGIINNAMVSYIDILPTILNWAGIDAPYKILSPNYSRPPQLDLPEQNGHYILPGRSLLPILEEENPPGWDTIYAAHSFHEITMYYPMRVIRTRKFKYILNIAYKLAFPIATDIYSSLTWQGIQSRKEKMIGIRSVESFIHRSREELYDIEKDPYEINNLAYDPAYKNILNELRKKLKEFQVQTDDIWLLKYKYE
jgi:N-sulfoglucosamine sulfohydrolase